VLPIGTTLHHGSQRKENRNANVPQSKSSEPTGTRVTEKWHGLHPLSLLLAKKLPGVAQNVYLQLLVACVRRARSRCAPEKKTILHIAKLVHP